MEEQDSKYTLVVNKKRIRVSKEIYTAYYQQKEREAYLNKLSNRYSLSFEECEEKGIQVDYILSRTEESLEDAVIKQEMFTRLMAAIEKLSEQERLLIYALFFKGISERQLAEQLNRSQPVIHKRKNQVLEKLKNFLEN